MSNTRAIAGLFLLAAACGPSTHREGPGGGGSGGSGSGGGGNGPDAGACASEMVSAQASPLDIFIMLDQSSSMTDSVAGGGTKWTAVTNALNAFVSQPGLSGVSVGIQYFGVTPGGAAACTAFTCTKNSDCGASACGPCTQGICVGAFTSGGDSCTASDYATPEVEISALPAAASMITASISHHSPTTGTPTSAALQGAVDHATAWANQHVGDVVVAVLATDGDPSECDTTLSDIDQIAATAYAGSPKISTFVIGVGSSLSNLNGIAAAGGTTQAFLVDTNGNANAQFLAAMNAIRNSATCTYRIPVPASGTPDYGTVNVIYTPSGGSPQTIPNVASKAQCPANGNGWYYDNPNMPSAILLCDSTCGTVKADAQGSVDISLGCATVIL